MWKDIDDLALIPKSYKIAGNKTVDIAIVESINDGGSYGDFSDAKSKIRLAKNIKVEDELIEISDEDILRTYLHELCHSMQFYYNCEYDEAQAQTFSNFMYEYLHTKQ